MVKVIKIIILVTLLKTFGLIINRDVCFEFCFLKVAIVSEDLVIMGLDCRVLAQLKQKHICWYWEYFVACCYVSCAVMLLVWCHKWCCLSAVIPGCAVHKEGLVGETRSLWQGETQGGTGTGLGRVPGPQLEYSSNEYEYSDMYE